jgi:hypothetical protein
MDRPADRLALIEVLDREGHVRRVAEVRQWPFSIGRDFGCDLVLDDPHVAPLHARIVASADEAAPLRLQAGATRNGVLVGSSTLLEGQSAPLPPPGQPWQVGATRLRVRLPGDAAEPEKPLGLARSGARPGITLASALALWALLLGEHAVMLDPGSRFTDWLQPLVMLPLALLLWCVLWAIGSKLFQHRFEFWPHFAIAVKGLLAAALLDLLLPLLAFSFSAEWLSLLTPTLAAAVLVAMLYRHAALVVPLDRRWLGGGIAVCFVLALGVLAALNLQRYDRLFAELYLPTLGPPALRLAPAVTPRVFFEEASALRAALQREAAREADDPD